MCHNTNGDLLVTSNAGKRANRLELWMSISPIGLSYVLLPMGIVVSELRWIIIPVQLKTNVYTM